MTTYTLKVPESLVARVDRALQREGLAVQTRGPRLDIAGRPLDEPSNVVVNGSAPAGVPRVIAYDGPVLPKVGDTARITIQQRK